MHQCKSRRSRVAPAAPSFSTVSMGNCWGKADEEMRWTCPDPPKPAPTPQGRSQGCPGLSPAPGLHQSRCEALGLSDCRCHPQRFNYSTVVAALCKDLQRFMYVKIQQESWEPLSLSPPAHPGWCAHFYPCPRATGAALGLLHPPGLGHTETALPGGQASSGGVLPISCLGRRVGALTDSHGDAWHLWWALGSW